MIKEVKVVYSIYCSGIEVFYESGRVANYRGFFRIPQTVNKFINSHKSTVEKVNEDLQIETYK